MNVTSLQIYLSGENWTVFSLSFKKKWRLKTRMFYKHNPQLQDMIFLIRLVSVYKKEMLNLYLKYQF